ncbi:MAG: lipid A deacylase LpxR family protein [Flavobacteriaceae bacterium]|nr:lipid A deacylase LpxR family protein [Flavobacteriaceae bacterium]
MRIYILFILTIFTCYNTQSQNKREVYLRVDNDLFISTLRDRYYTNGVFLGYTHLIEKNNNYIVSYGLAHKMYNPRYRIVRNKEKVDRPFAAHIYMSASVKKITNDYSFNKIELQIGKIGPDALGEELQNLMHSIIGKTHPIGWEYQIQNTTAIQLNHTYARSLLPNSNHIFDIVADINTNIGTIHKNSNLSLAFKISLNGKTNLSKSILYNNHLNNSNNRETIIFLKPTISYVRYNTTIQGSIYDDLSPITFDINTVVYSGEIGFKAKREKYTYGYKAAFYTKRNEKAIENISYYGNIFYSYLF